MTYACDDGCEEHRVEEQAMPAWDDGQLDSLRHLHAPLRLRRQVRQPMKIAACDTSQRQAVAIHLDEVTLIRRHMQFRAAPSCEDHLPGRFRPVFGHTARPRCAGGKWIWRWSTSGDVRILGDALTIRHHTPVIQHPRHRKRCDHSREQVCNGKLDRQLHRSMPHSGQITATVPCKSYPHVAQRPARLRGQRRKQPGPNSIAHHTPP